MQPKDDVFVIVAGVADVLTYENEIGLERSGTTTQNGYKRHVDVVGVEEDEKFLFEFSAQYTTRQTDR